MFNVLLFCMNLLSFLFYGYYDVYVGLKVMNAYFIVVLICLYDEGMHFNFICFRFLS